jgi:AraC-like DNA-binding protein
MEMGSSLLGQFPVVCTRIPGELEAVLVRRFALTTFDLPDGGRGFRATFNDVQLSHVGLSYCDRTAARFGFPGTDCARQLICIGGSATARVGGGLALPLDPQGACTISPGTAWTIEAADSLELLAIRIAAGELERKLAALLGFRPQRPLQFAPAADARQPVLQSFHRLVMHAAGQLDSSRGALPPPMVAELEQSLIVAFLCCNTHEFSDLLTKPAAHVAPWQVRLVEDYVEANWDHAITVEALSEATGASVRAIFNCFKRSRGYSPMAFLKQVRLRHASEMLMRSDAGASVTGIALACCFQNVGHFARDYRATFGELPSQTLARARGAQSMIPKSGHRPPERITRKPSAHAGR